VKDRTVQFQKAIRYLMHVSGFSNTRCRSPALFTSVLPFYLHKSSSNKYKGTIFIVHNSMNEEVVPFEPINEW
jgi:hypothetical protein